MRRLKRRAAASLFSPPRKRADHSGLMSRVRQDADRIARHFGLTYREIAPEKPQVKRRYGVCYADGRIAVRLTHAKTGAALKYSSLINTVCHELAHLKHFNHGPRFKSYYLQILEYARREGIYRPGKSGGVTPVQLELFAGGLTRSEGMARRFED